jgi:hypothetical protein
VSWDKGKLPSSGDGGGCVGLGGMRRELYDNRFCIPFAFHLEGAARIFINSMVFDVPESATLLVYVVDITVLRSFPSWTSPVRIRSPAPSFQ